MNQKREAGESLKSILTTEYLRLQEERLSVLEILEISHHFADRRICSTVLRTHSVSFWRNLSIMCGRLIMSTSQEFFFMNLEYIPSSANKGLMMCNSIDKSDHFS
jgi:hypothetical protein